jgi:hypothetical protein
MGSRKQHLFRNGDPHAIGSYVPDSSRFAPSQVLLLEKALGRFNVLPATQCNNIKKCGEIEIYLYVSSPTDEDRE